MDKNLLTYSALSVAVVASGVAALAVLKWHQISKKLKKYVEKYDEPKEVQRFLLQHYGCLNDLPLLKSLIPEKAEDYHSELAYFVITTCKQYKVPNIRILDVGCGPGGTSFHLSNVFQDVIGTDTSMSMIMSGQQMKQFAEFGSPFSSEGGKYISLFKMRIPDDSERGRVTFWDEDVCALSHSCGKFDCVLVSNTLTEMHNPKAFLQDIGKYVNKEGLLIIADVYNWDDGPEEKLDGLGNELTFSLLKTILSTSWTLVKETNLPYYIPKCARLAELGNAHVTVWKKMEENI